MGETRIITSVVPADMIDTIWDQCVDLFDKPIKLCPLDISRESIKSSLLAGHTTMIMVSDVNGAIAVNILEKMTFGTGHIVLYISIMSGTRMSEWLDDFMLITHGIARQFKCKEIRCISQRKGWVRAFNSAGHQWYDINNIIGCKVQEI